MTRLDRFSRTRIQRSPAPRLYVSATGSRSSARADPCSSGRKGKTNTTYQRLEFLGDRVLGLVIAEELYVRNPRTAKARSLNLQLLVRGETCADAARELGLADHIRVGTKEKAQGMATQTLILGDVMEAMLGAIYLDGGLEPRAAYHATYGNGGSPTAQAGQGSQELPAGMGAWQAHAIPGYRIVSREGPDHGPHFTVGVSVEGFSEAVASAQSKRIGEQVAAEAFLRREEIRK